MKTLDVLVNSFINCLYLWLEGWDKLSQWFKIEWTSVDKIYSEEGERLKLALQVQNELEMLKYQKILKEDDALNKKFVTISWPIQEKEPFTKASIQDLKNLKEEIRIFKFTWKKVDDFKSWTEIELNLIKDSKDIFYLSELPESILSIEYAWKIYNRSISSRWWEFITTENYVLKSDNTEFEILQPIDKMKIKVLQTRDSFKISDKLKEENESLSEKTILDKTILLEIKKRWLNDKILFDEVKKEILSDDEDIISDDPQKKSEFDSFMSKKYLWYPKNLNRLNESIDKVLDKYRFNKWVYNTPKEVLEKIEKTKDTKKQQEMAREALQSQIDTASKISPEKWTEKVSLENPEMDALKNSFFWQFLNWIFKALLWVDLFSWISTLNGVEEDLNNPEKAKEKMWSLVWGEESGELGSLSAHFESWSKWPYAINPDDGWMPSYWSYQLRDWALKKFADKYWIKWNYREKWKNTEFAKNWKSKVDSIWVKKFKKTEHEFIKETHYDPQMQKIQTETWVDLRNSSMSLRNVVWSSAVQHWAESKYVVKAIKELQINDFSNLSSQKKLIEKIYELRKTWVNWSKNKYGDKFIKNIHLRYDTEKSMALQNLNITSWEKDVKIEDKTGAKIDIPKWIISFPKEYSEKWTTMCSRTAYKNITQTFWIQSESWDAKAIYEKYKNKWEITNDFPPKDWKVADLFMASIKHPQYWHRSVAFNDNWKWYVLDPYLPATWSYTRNPIPWETYKSYLDRAWRSFYWAKIY